MFSFSFNDQSTAYCCWCWQQASATFVIDEVPVLVLVCIKNNDVLFYENVWEKKFDVVFTSNNVHRDTLEPAVHRRPTKLLSRLGAPPDQA